MPTSSNRKEQPATKYIPYQSHLDEHTCVTVDGDVTRTIQLAGVPFETLANDDFNALSRQWFSTINNIGAKNTRVALWTHVVRRKLRYDLSQIEYDNYFSQELNAQYAKRLESKDFYSNELYISPVYRPAPNDAERMAQKLSTDVEQQRLMRSAGAAELDKITNQMMVSLRRYHPTMLGIVETEKATDTEEAVYASDLARFYSRILNGGDSGPIPLLNYSIRYAIQRSDINFDGDIIEIIKPDSTRYAGILTLKAPYAVEKVRANILHGLLRLPCEYILSQSLTFLPTNKADKFLQIQESQIAGTSGNELQLKELSLARAELQNGKFGMGEHEFILTLFGDSVREVSEAISLATTAMEEKNMTVFRETRGTLITQYFSMLPANFKMKRIRAMPISTDNFTSFFPMHNFMTGNAQGSQWGMPLAMLETTSGSPYFVNYHVSRKALQEQGVSLEYDHDDAEPEAVVDEGDEEAQKQKEQRKESGNYLLIGPNGSGKTVVQTFLRALTHKKFMHGPRPYKSFAFDKDLGQEIFIRALGGRYFTFEPGAYAGINPFSLPNNPRSHLFIIGLAQWCARQDPTYKASVQDEMYLKRAVLDVYELTKKRRWARMRDLLPQEGPGSLYDVLGRYVDDGVHAWVLDSEEDRLDLEGANDFGFDMTTFLYDDFARTPILKYIKHKIDTVAPGSPYSIDIDEASTALKDPYMREEIIDIEARTIRKKIGVIGLGLQNASDASTGALASTLSNQFPTAFIFPNPKADRKDYMEGLKLTEREFQLVQSGMLDEPGKFLLKKGLESVVVKADLTGMNNILSVLSGSADNVPIVRGLIHELGNDPSKWLPEFFKRRV